MTIEPHDIKQSPPIKRAVMSKFFWYCRTQIDVLAWPGETSNHAIVVVITKSLPNVVRHLIPETDLNTFSISFYYF